MSGTYVELVFVVHGVRSAVVDGHGPLRKAKVLLQLGVHEEDWFAELGGTFVQSLLK